MNTQTESKLIVTISEAAIHIENPIQERHCDQISESVEMTAEAVFMARRLEALSLSKGRIARFEAGPVFVP